MLNFCCCTTKRNWLHMSIILSHILFLHPSKPWHLTFPLQPQLTRSHVILHNNFLMLSTPPYLKNTLTHTEAFYPCFRRSLSLTLPLAATHTHTHTHTHLLAPAHAHTSSYTFSAFSSASSHIELGPSNSDTAPPAMRTLSCSRSESPSHLPLAKPKLYMPQVAFHPLPVLKEGEGLAEENENEFNDGQTINIVNGQDSWT